MKQTDKMQILVVGGGSIGERHLRCFQATGRAFPALCEPNRKLRERLASRYNVPAFASFEEAVPANSFDAAVICTPANLHTRLARESLSAGMAVLIEKPLSTSLEGVDDLRSLHKRSGLQVAVAYVLRFVPALQAIHARIQSGELGNPKQIALVSGQHFPTFRPTYREIYYAKHSSGGGAIQDALTHLANTVEWLVGPTTSLFCDASRQVLEGVDVEDTVNVLARNGEVQVSYALNQFQAPNEHHLWIHCTRGSAKVELHRSRWGVLPLGEEKWRWTSASVDHRDALFIAQAEGFLDSLLGKNSNLCSLADGIQTLKFNLAALESSAKGTKVTLASNS